MSCCLDCGEAFEQVGSGRPRKRCVECSPRKRTPKGNVDVECGWCRVRFRGRSNAKYCSAACRELGRSVECSGCGKRVSRSRTSAVEQYCLTCRREGRAPHKHGYSGYRRGCRCEVCTVAQREKMRVYSAQRASSGNPIIRRRTKPCVCEHCGISFMGLSFKPGRYCSTKCAKFAQGWDGSDGGKRDRFYVSASVRLAIYEGANWACQICSSPTRPNEDHLHPRYPTLDHILPRSLGGSDEVNNLRLACRQCNVTRGANVDWMPEVIHESVREAS